MNDMVSSRKTGGFDWSGTVQSVTGIRGQGSASGNEHAIAVAEEAVSLLDGVGVGGEDSFASGECGNQHEQARLGQVEVGQHGVDQLELEAGGDEDFRRAGVRFERAAGGTERSGFERADGCCPGGYDAAGTACSGVNSLRCLSRQRIALAMQANIGEPVNTKRGERSEAHVQCNASYFDAAGSEGIEDLRGEVEARGGGSHGAALGRIDRLVALAIGGGIVAADIGRQWHVADAVEDGKEIVHRLKAEQALTVLSAFQDLSL